MAIQGLKRNIFQRIFGIPATKLPGSPDCWRYEQGSLTITLGKAPELEKTGGAIRVEGKQLPMRVLVYRDDEGKLRAVRNECSHMGRRVDPVAGHKCLQCCSVGATAYDYSGKKLEGPGERPLTLLDAEENDGQLVVKLG